jgi:hypothetical protein
MGEGGLPRWLRWWGGAAIAALCTGAAFLAEVLPDESLSPRASLSIKVGGAVAAMLVVLLLAKQTWDDAQEREDTKKLAKAKVADYQLTLESVLMPLTEIFDRIITAPNEVGRIEARRAIKKAVVNSFVQFAGAPRARSRYFDYEHSGRLVCRGIHAGLDSRPRTEFSSADPNHAEIFQLLESRQPGLREYVDAENPPRFPLERDNKTFLYVPVATSAEIFGLLTLDAPGDLNLQHLNEMLLLAQLLGIALASNGSSRASTNSTANRGQRPTRPARSATKRGDSTA